MAIATGDAGVREGHAGEVLHRVVAGDAFAAGEGREPARRGTARDRPRQAAGHRRAGLPADRHRRGQAPVPGRRGFLREAERGVRHEPEVRTVGEVFGDGDMAAAVIDRIVHHGRIVRFRGESYRDSHSLMR